MKEATASDCNVNVALAPVSPLQRDEAFLSKLVSRDATPACVSSRSYYRSCAHVPFEWETQPGLPKNPTEGELMLPPLSPPPAMQRARLVQHIHSGGVPGNDRYRRGRSNSRRRHAPSSMAFQGCLVLKPIKLTLFGAATRREFSRALLSMFRAA